MRKLLLLCSFLLLASANFAQYTDWDTLPPPFLTRQDTVFLKVGAFGQKTYEHVVQPKQTLYSLAKFFGLEIADLMFFNPDLHESGLHPNQRIQVPIPNRAILRYKTEDYRPWSFIPVYYVVQAGDTFYGIAKRHFKMEVEELLRKNQLETTTVKMGQKIHVGWMSIHGIPEEWRELATSPLEKLNKRYRTYYRRQMTTQREYIQTGKAIWQKDNDMNAGLLALHREAPMDSYISITNPDNNITFYAKVVGRLPTKYDRNVVVIASPTIARALGAVDEQFFVQLRYCR